MPFQLDTPTLIIICAAISVVLFAEAVYLLGFSTASYRSQVNRRLKISANRPDREAILIQLRRERGLTGDGLFRFGLQWFNRLMLESGMTRGFMTLGMVGFVGGVAGFVGVLKFREDMMEAGLAGLALALLLPMIALVIARKRRHGKFAAQFPDAMDIIVMTESGVNYSLERVAPGKRFHFVANENCNCSECPFMKLNTLEKLRDGLTTLEPRVELAPDLMQRALLPLERMLAVK